MIIIFYIAEYFVAKEISNYKIRKSEIIVMLVKQKSPIIIASMIIVFIYILS